MDHRKAGAPFVATLAVIAGCSDHRLPPNPVPNAEVRRELPAWFDPNARWNPNSGDNRVYIEGKIVFAVDKAIIKPESEKVLQTLLKFLQEHPEVTRLTIEGHTDSTAGDEYNQELSAKRSLAVCDWLVDRGIDHLRVVAVGFGEKKPIGPNDTAPGRSDNRRTEFHVMEVSGRPFGPNNQLDGGMVLSVLSAEERAKLKNPDKVVFKKPPPYQPTGDEVKEVKATPKKQSDDEAPVIQAPGASPAGDAGKAGDGKGGKGGGPGGTAKPGG